MFSKLWQISLGRRRLLPFVETLIDDDILVAIGEAQVRGAPCGFKEMANLRLTCLSTLQRRIDRLVKLKLVRRRAQAKDARCVTYTLSPKAMAAYEAFFAIALAMDIDITETRRTSRAAVEFA